MKCPPIQKRLALPLSVWILILILFDVVIMATHGTEEEEEKDNVDIETAIREVFGTPPASTIETTTPSFIGNCTCVTLNQCGDNGITDVSHIIQIRNSEVCCYNVKTPKVSNNDLPMKCGRSKNVGFRITSDDEAQFGDFPWMVAILKSNSQSYNPTYVCGGSLIHPKVVLTAVHCINNIDPNELVIRVGDWDLKTDNELFHHQNGYVLSIIKHKNYFSGSLINDVALIVLTRQFILQENVGTICLPPQGYKFNREKCYASGWGKNAFDDSDNEQSILKKIDLPIVPYNTCLNRLRRTRLGPTFNLHNSFICAGGEVGKDTCKGDGGSPLTCPTDGDPDQSHQAGIVAWGIGCGENIPGVYVDVARFRDWIDQQMADHDLDTSYYTYDDPDY